MKHSRKLFSLKKVWFKLHLRQKHQKLRHPIKIAIFFFACILLSLSGCHAFSPQEKRGYSSIPQNRPTSWESRPYGDNIGN
ncbi:MAG: hypothetical protein GX280_08305 [Lentisphaerae bacterium]|nr:hypothetical protein [Lentisphaerota bacterium]